MIEAYPLHWPAGHQRANERKDSRFELTPSKAFDELVSEVKRLAGQNSNLIISTNVPVRKKDGGIYSDIAKDEIGDPGVAVYFMYEGEQVVLCCDKWKTPADNIRSISLTVSALRGLDRWGVSDMLKRTFSGFKALPESTNLRKWWEVLEMSEPTKSQVEISSQYKALVKKVHPDKGGSVEAFQELQSALQQAIEYAKN